MTGKRIIIILAVGAILFIAALLYSILPRTKNVSKYSPFKELIGNELLTAKPTVLIKLEKSDQTFVEYGIYDIDPYYEAVIEASPEKWELPAGTKLHIVKAKLHYGAVAGVTVPYVIGTVKHPETGEVIEFEYSWGRPSISLSSEKGKEGWLFPLAAWQEVADTNRYILPKFN